MNGRNSIAKYAKKFSERSSKKSPENDRYRETVKTEMISLSYDVNDHVYYKSKFV